MSDYLSSWSWMVEGSSTAPTLKVCSAQYRCTKSNRPWAKPHFGSVIERLFDTTNSQFVYTLLGNTQAAKRARMLTRGVHPKEHALWTLSDLYTYLAEYVYVIYDQNEHSSLGRSPQSTYQWGMKQGGEREHRRIAYDERFLKQPVQLPPKRLHVFRREVGSRSTISITGTVPF